MDIFILVIIAIIGIEHIGIGLFEMFGSTAKQADAFDMPGTFVQQKNAKTALKNQGIYNLMLGILILAVILIFTGATLKTLMLLLTGYVMVVAIFGAFTVTKKIIFLQGLPALIGFLLVLFFY
ncbi:DUF1304 domain-containing protein [Companilactobacillus ginsenosidimutans]|uniref:Membrane protein n=1 Tax=Companilactobacillus ginsenosidimutans TaxID=1007676 RepID=A0A0H4QL05_9LACO|nr:DUF1304 domain-containing protein [Companilactobacillus ginsenosidimutans]AKP67786.1 membrane protein [Companilactobacillus ginsenosidimutans]